MHSSLKSAHRRHAAHINSIHTCLCKPSCTALRPLWIYLTVSSACRSCRLVVRDRPENDKLQKSMLCYVWPETDADMTVADTCDQVIVIESQKVQTPRFCQHNSRGMHDGSRSKEPIARSRIAWTQLILRLHSCQASRMPREAVESLLETLHVQVEYLTYQAPEGILGHIARLLGWDARPFRWGKQPEAKQIRDALHHCNVTLGFDGSGLALIDTSSNSAWVSRDPKAVDLRQ